MAGCAVDRSRRIGRHGVVGEVLVRLVVDVEEAAIPAEGVHRTERLGGVHRARRVVGRHGDDGPRPGCNRIGDGLHVELIVVERGDRDRACARDDDRHLVVEVVRRRQDHLVARIGHREDGVHEREVAAGRHHDPARSADPYAVLPRELVLDGPDERGQPFDRTVPMVRQRLAKAPRCLDRFRRRTVRHDTLPQRDRAGSLGDPAADDGDDRCLDRGETGGLRVEVSARRHVYQSV